MTLMESELIWRPGFLWLNTKPLGGYCGGGCPGHGFEIVEASSREIRRRLSRVRNENRAQKPSCGREAFESHGRGLFVEPGMKIPDGAVTRFFKQRPKKKEKKKTGAHSINRRGARKIGAAPPRSSTPSAPPAGLEGPHPGPSDTWHSAPAILILIRHARASRKVEGTIGQGWRSGPHLRFSKTLAEDCRANFSSFRTTLLVAYVTQNHAGVTDTRVVIGGGPPPPPSAAFPESRGGRTSSDICLWRPIIDNSAVRSFARWWTLLLVVGQTQPAPNRSTAVRSAWSKDSAEAIWSRDSAESIPGLVAGLNTVGPYRGASAAP